MTIMTHVKRRTSQRTVNASLQRLRQEMRQARADEHRYDGGLPAEQSSLYQLQQKRRRNAKAKRRALLISRVGRRIDLAALLNQRRRDELPRWAIVDPTRFLGNKEGQFDSDGMHCIGGYWRTIRGAKKLASGKSFLPVGMPALPPRIRELATDPNIRRRARWVGVLYQPEEWREVEPDPALVVEWKARPGEYYALAVWGHDGPAIMEFVD